MPVEPRQPGRPLRHDLPTGKQVDVLEREDILAEADELLDGRVRLFGRGPFRMGSPPDWMTSPLSGAAVVGPGRHWSAIGDFDSGAGDIKGVWEISRFGWTVVLALAFRASGDTRYLDTLNAWVRDWVRHNPLNQGPNWKCGQEASIRLLHILMAARILSQHTQPNAELVRFATDHLHRIESTLRYGMAQDNNHGTSEAAGLYVGGAWLSSVAQDTVLARRARGWERKGRRNLIDRVLRLVAGDGSFSQHSVNYHRMVVDTLAQVELWRRQLGRPAFPESYLAQCRKAVKWLATFTDTLSGDAPNVGENDGAHVFRTTTAGFRDYRPSVELGMRLFYAPHETDPDLSCAGRCRIFDSGGYARLDAPGSADTWAMIRFPRYRFRPGHSDPLHLDLWHQGTNVLRDGGSFSYNVREPDFHRFISGPAGHNTIQFDGRDPMPRIDRFLRQHWLHASYAAAVDDEGGCVRWSGIYRDHKRAEHERTVAARTGVWDVIDRVYGFCDRAVLRWRLAPADWRLVGTRCEACLATISLHTLGGFRRIELVEGWESRHYSERTALPVLEAEVAAAGRWIEIHSRIELRQRPE